MFFKDPGTPVPPEAPKWKLGCAKSAITTPCQALAPGGCWCPSKAENSTPRWPPRSKTGKTAHLPSRGKVKGLGFYPELRSRASAVVSANAAAGCKSLSDSQRPAHILKCMGWDVGRFSAVRSGRSSPCLRLNGPTRKTTGDSQRKLRASTPQCHATWGETHQEPGRASDS